MKNSDMTFKTIGVITRPNTDPANETLLALFNYLKDINCVVILDDEIPETLNTHHFIKSNRAEIGKLCDLAIVVGGDGTILNAVRTLVHAQVPIVSINVGRLGFLADISPNELEKSLTEIFNGQYREEQRILTEMTVIRGGKVIFEADAFNDVVVHKRNIVRMIEFEISIDGEFVNHQRADGIIVSTPTGSTAYALSSGGPILHASLDVITLVPVSPHTLSSRPLVVSADAEIKILICKTKEDTAQATCDGHLSIGVHDGDQIIIKRKAEKITMLHPKHHNYFEILRAKLRWSEHS